MPKKIANAPELTDAEQFYMQAHVDLLSERSSEGLTRRSAVIDYGKDYFDDAESIEDLLEIIRELDNYFITRANTKQVETPSEPDNKPAKGKPRLRRPS